jgi:hypothetical protein
VQRDSYKLLLAVLGRACNAPFGVARLVCVVVLLYNSLTNQFHFDARPAAYSQEAPWRGARVTEPE